MIRIAQIKAGIRESEKDALKRELKKLGIRGFGEIRIVKKAVDARRRAEPHYVYTVETECENEDALVKKHPNITKAEKYSYKFPKGRLPENPVIVGFGPAGMFAGLYLARAGARPIIIERGKRVEERAEDVEKMRRLGILNPESNAQFGEGGAGTFSDGKLATGIKDVRIRAVLEDFVKHGAPEDILYLSKPHLGTDKLRGIVRSIRGEIEALGGEVRFKSRLSDIIIDNGSVSGVVVNGEYEIKTGTVILAAGHSARDLFELLKRLGVRMEQKPFSVGARIEHPQEMISRGQYGDCYRELPPADYKGAVHLRNGRGVYTFCMCPGGEVIAAASEEGGVVTNGMSLYSRSGKNANSAVLVGVSPEDFGSDDPLAGIELQRKIERAAFNIGGGAYTAVCQTAEDFLCRRPSRGQIAGGVIPSYRPGVVWGDIGECLPDYVTESLREGICLLGEKIKGFSFGGAVLTAPETRSSSPVRFIRDKDTYELSVKGLYSAGEGGGHAGGITSSAVDGIKCAEHTLK